MASFSGGADIGGTRPLEPVDVRWQGSTTADGPLTVRDWRNCHASLTLIAEINAQYPNRDKASDGTIGDAAHATRQSDHNPWVVVNGMGVVRARDIDKDGVPLADIMEYLRTLGAKRDPRLYPNGYLIYNRRITNPDFRQWREYTGSNPHTQHGHVSFSTEVAGFDSTAPWGISNNGTSEDMQKDERDTLFRVAGLCDAMFQQMAGPLTKVGDPKYKGWGAWNGGTGESLTMIDYERRANTLLADVIRRLDNLPKGAAVDPNVVVAAVREAMDQDNSALADQIVDRLVARLSN